MKLKFIFTIACLFCVSVFVFGQKTNKQTEKKITITGVVLSPDKKPVEGAYLYIDGKRTNFKSKKDGTYKINADHEAYKLFAWSSEYGFGEKEIGGQTNLDLALNGITNIHDLKTPEFVRKDIVQDSINKSRKSKPKKMNTYTDIYQMIRAEVSGVVVSGRSITIQQGHSFFGSSEPLFVVNGTIVSSIDYVNPIEVKSIQVLKGSAAAIYGVRGSNGVISITLKNGTEKEK
jgi:TonB-dependent SusC/RagA subfamily outer membrane receptor